MTTTTETPTEPVYLAITKVDLKALRTCDSVCFDHSPVGTHGIRAIKRGPAPWYIDTTCTVRVKSSVFIHGDGLDYDYKHGKTARCFESFSSQKYNEEWQTVLGLLKEGDEIELRWVGADNNGYVGRSTITETNEHGSPGLGMKLHCDRLYLYVWRGGKRKYSFYLCDSICPNNTARMIRP